MDAQRSNARESSESGLHSTRRGQPEAGCDSGRLVAREVVQEPGHPLQRPSWRRDCQESRLPALASQRCLRKAFQISLPLLGTAVLVGATSGLAELCVRLVQIHWFHLINQSALRTTRHLAWMLPIASILLCLGITTAVLAVTALRLVLLRRSTGSDLELAETKRSRKAVGLLHGVFLLAGPLLALRGIHPAGAILLAVGAGWRIRAVMALFPSKFPGAATIGGSVVASLALVAPGLQACLGRVSVQPAQPHRPGTRSLVFIVLDTVRADRLSLYGYTRPTTPAIDSWAAKGVTFDLAYSAAPWTLPSHLTMFTGLWPYEHGARIDRPYTGDSPTLAEHFRSRGYATAGFVANTRMCNALYGIGRGFQTYIDDPVSQEVSLRAFVDACSISEGISKLAWRIRGQEEPLTWTRRRAPEVLADARRWLMESRGNVSEAPTPGSKQFFLFVNLMDAHGPYIPPTSAIGTYSQFAAPRPKEAQPARGWLAVKARNEASPASRPERQRELDEVTTRLSDLYDDCLLGLDAAVGRFLDDLHGAGILDNAWVVITSDHGEHFGEHDLFGHGASLYNELTHVPLVIIPPLASDPKRSTELRGRRVSAPVSLRDLPVTLAALLDPEVIPPFPGHSLARHWESEQFTRDPILAQIQPQPLEGQDVQSEMVVSTDAVIHDDRILIESNSGGPELFDLHRDRLQRANLVALPSEHERLRRLRVALDCLRRADRRIQ